MDFRIHQAIILQADLDENRTSANFALVRNEGGRTVPRDLHKKCELTSN